MGNKYAKKGKQKNSLWVAVIAVVCLLLLIGVGAFFISKSGDSQPGGTQTTPTPAPTATPIPEGALYIPAAEVPDVSTGESIRPFVYYNGKVYFYTWSYGFSPTAGGTLESVDMSNKEGVYKAIASFIGNTVSVYDEGTIRGDNEVILNLASTSVGTVYGAVGYDEDFRICISGDWTNDEGETVYYLDYYECLSDIYLTKGSDLITDRLYLYARIPNTTEQNIKDFVTAMNEAPFVYLEPNTATGDEVPMLNGEPDFRYIEDYSTVVEFVPADTVPITFTVYKNGYVRYDGYGLENYYMTVDPAAVAYLFE